MALDVDESYSLTISENAKTTSILISASTFFGARHGLDTLSQLISFDQLEGQLAMASDVKILNDKPQFPYRGIMLDLSRNFLPPSSIENTVRAMVSAFLVAVAGR